MSRVQVIDRGWNKIKGNLSRGKDVSVKVGVQGSDGEVVDIAIYNEFGTKTIPARPFMRTATDANRANIAKIMTVFAGRIVEGKMEMRTALGQVGQWFEDRIKQHIADSKSWAQENAPSTIAGKGSSTPLIDTGRLRQSIRWVLGR